MKVMGGASSQLALVDKKISTFYSRECSACLGHTVDSISHLIDTWCETGGLKVYDSYVILTTKSFKAAPGSNHHGIQKIHTQAICNGILLPQQK